MTLRFTMLGCGSSPGVPRPNGDWGACDPAEPRNRRTRAAMLVQRTGEGGTTTVVIDTGPDLRAQLIAARVTDLHAVVLTHPHADHIHGIDDVRTFVLVSRRVMPVWADEETFARVHEAFGYVFETPPGSEYPPICAHRPIEPYVPFTVDGPGGPIQFEPLAQEHARIRSLGFRVGDVAYCSDVSAFPSETEARLGGLDTLVLGALQYHRHPSHFSVEQALEVVARLKPRRTILTHMHIPLDYRKLAAELPEGVEPGHDGLAFEHPSTFHNADYAIDASTSGGAGS